jgi:hypothetical protein
LTERWAVPSGPCSPPLRLGAISVLPPRSMLLRLLLFLLRLLLCLAIRIEQGTWV